MRCVRAPARLALIMSFVASTTTMADEPASRPASSPTTRPASRPTSSTDPALEELQRALEADSEAAGDSKSASKPAVPLVSTLTRTFQSLNPDISFITDVAAAYFSADDPLMGGGHDPTKTGFNLQQLELYVSGAVDPYFRFDANLVFSQFGVEIEEVYATTLALPWNLQLRAGQFLTRFGRINNSHPHTWNFVDQMLVMGKFFGGGHLEGGNLHALRVKGIHHMAAYTVLARGIHSLQNHQQAMMALSIQKLL